MHYGQQLLEMTVEPLEMMMHRKILNKMKKMMDNLEHPLNLPIEEIQKLCFSSDCMGDLVNGFD